MLIKEEPIIPRLALDTFYLHTEFGDFCCSHDWRYDCDIVIENGSCDPDHAPFRGGLSSKSYDLIQSTYLYAKFDDSIS